MLSLIFNVIKRLAAWTAQTDARRTQTHAQTKYPCSKSGRPCGAVSLELPRLAQH